MGLFGSKATCAVCNKEIGLNKFQIANKEWVCPECFKKAGFNMMTPIKNMTVADINAAIQAQEANAELYSEFNATKKVGGFLEIDGNKKQWLIPAGKKKCPKVYNYSDIADFELLEDGESITKGGLGRALVGGALFGGVGAVVGGVTGHKKNKPICDSLRIKITVNDMNNPAVYINFVETKTKKDGFLYKALYKSAQECLSTLQLVCNGVKPTEENNNTISSADEILKFKKLMDDGVITQEEFEAKKKQLLGL